MKIKTLITRCIKLLNSPNVSEILQCKNISYLKYILLFWTFYSILKKKVSTKTLSSTNVFNIDNNKKGFLSSKLEWFLNDNLTISVLHHTIECYMIQWLKIYFKQSHCPLFIQMSFFLFCLIFSSTFGDSFWCCIAFKLYSFQWQKETSEDRDQEKDCDVHSKTMKVLFYYWWYYAWYQRTDGMLFM